MSHFAYGEPEIAHLKSRDARLGAVMDRIGHIHRKTNPDLFEATVHHIISQQISSKGAATVWSRLLARFGSINPHTLAAAPVTDIQQCGMSGRKASCIQEFAHKVHDGSFDLNHLHSLPDEAVCAHLSTLRGVGVWTAEMLMTFSMQRPNVMSWDDLAIHRGLRMLYRHRSITRPLFARYKKRYAPYATVASLYLWAIAGGALAEMTDPAASRRPLDARRPSSRETS